MLSQTSFTILFYAFVVLILYINRNKFEKQGIINLYRTKLGLKTMDSVAQKCNKAVKLFGYIAIGVAYVGFVFVTYLLVKLIFLMLTIPETPGVSPVIPGLPIAGTDLIFPLVTGWIVLLLVIIVHEFSHGVVARAYGLKIKSSGFAFLGPIPGAFVEPDEKEIQKKSISVQNSIYAAGPFSNIILAIIALLILMFASQPLISSVSDPIGLKISPIINYSAEKAGLQENTILYSLNGVNATDLQKIQEYTANLKPNDTIIFETDKGTIEFKATEKPDNTTKGYMGIYIKGLENRPNGKLEYILYHSYVWFFEFLFWLYFISLNVGLFNLYPLFITDGARISKTTIERYEKDKKKSTKYFTALNKAAFLLLILIIVIQITNFLMKFLPNLF